MGRGGVGTGGRQVEIQYNKINNLYCTHEICLENLGGVSIKCLNVHRGGLETCFFYILPKNVHQYYCITTQLLLNLLFIL